MQLLDQYKLSGTFNNLNKAKILWLMHFLPKEIKHIGVLMSRQTWHLMQYRQPKVLFYFPLAVFHETTSVTSIISVFLLFYHSAILSTFTSILLKKQRASTWSVNIFADVYVHVHTRFFPKMLSQIQSAQNSTYLKIVDANVWKLLWALKWINIPRFFIDYSWQGLPLKLAQWLLKTAVG